MQVKVNINLNISEYKFEIATNETFFFPGRKGSSLRIKSDVSLSSLPAGEMEKKDEQENKKVQEKTRSSLRRLSLKRLRRTKSAHKSSETKQKFQKEEISLPQNVDSIRSKFPFFNFMYYQTLLLSGARKWVQFSSKSN